MSASLSLRDRLNATVRDIPRSGIRDFFDLVTTMKDVISLGIGEPDFDTPWHVRESTVFALERGATHYTSNFGYLELRRALARYVSKTFGAEYNPENEVLITVGVSEALDLRCGRCSTRAMKSCIMSRATCLIVRRYCSRTGRPWRSRRVPTTGSA